MLFPKFRTAVAMAAVLVLGAAAGRGRRRPAHRHRRHPGRHRAAHRRAGGPQRRVLHGGVRGQHPQAEAGARPRRVPGHPRPAAPLRLRRHGQRRRPVLRRRLLHVRRPGRHDRHRDDGAQAQRRALLPLGPERGQGLGARAGGRRLQRPAGGRQRHRRLRVPLPGHAARRSPAAGAAGCRWPSRTPSRPSPCAPSIPRASGRSSPTAPTATGSSTWS